MARNGTGGVPLARGTATTIESVIPAAEAQKAAAYVQSAIAGRREELDRLNGFAADNVALVALVNRLPDELHHDIMVPFGSVAFFPGRLVHTNEFLVLLGEGYYAERTAKQTVEILQRRGRNLEAQMDSLKATMLDLEAEAKFFDSTAAEAAEGLVEIREDYVEEPTRTVSVPEFQSIHSSEAASLKDSQDNEGFAQMMKALDDLEKKELEAESLPEDEEFNNRKDDPDVSTSQSFFHDCGENSEGGRKSKAGGSSTTVSGKNYYDERSFSAIPNIGTQRQHVETDSTFEQSFGTGKPRLPLDFKENRLTASKFEDSSDNIDNQIPTMGYRTNKAFTGTVIERPDGLLPSTPNKNSSTNQPSSSNPSKPVSRFKMQKGGR